VGGADPGSGGEVKHRLSLPQRVVDHTSGRVDQVGEDPDGGRGRHVGPPVDGDDALPAGGECLHEVPTDEAGGAGDHDGHRLRRPSR
jgi:hypothetical protein